jgi:integrase
MSDGMKNVTQLKELIAENIRLDDFYKAAGDNSDEREMVREIYDTICDVVCFPRKSITIRGTSYPWQVVKSQFMKLRPIHISNLLGRLIDNSLGIRNMEYEREFLLKKANDVNMGFVQFVEIYMADMKPRLKLNTFLTKKHIIETKIIPYFKNKSLADITAMDIIQWQNLLLSMRDENDKPYSQTYLRTIQNQLSAIFNHACRFYGLSVNPAKTAGKMGKAKGKEMLFWTKEEYLKFAEIMKEKPISYYAFEVLYWTGIREGELLALERGDFNIENRKLTINKSYQHLQGKDYITAPKTEKSNRVIELPEFLCREMEDYFGMLYKCDEHARLFIFSKSYLHHEMDRGAKAAGVKRIRIHDLRHSHVAHCIELGFSPMAIAERMGHEGISITYNYAHLYPSKQKELADKLDEDRIIADDIESADEAVIEEKDTNKDGM